MIIFTTKQKSKKKPEKAFFAQETMYHHVALVIWYDSYYLLWLKDVALNGIVNDNCSLSAEDSRFSGQFY